MDYVGSITGITFTLTADGSAADFHFSNGNVSNAAFAGYTWSNWSYHYNGAREITRYTADSYVFIATTDYPRKLTPTAANGTAAETLAGGNGNDLLQGGGLSLFDGGMAYADVVALAIGTAQFQQLAGSRSNAAFVTTVYRNVVGVAPTTTERDSFVAQLDNGTHTQTSLGVLAAQIALNALNALNARRAWRSPAWRTPASASRRWAEAP